MKGCEIAHQILERIAHFLPKSELMSNSLIPSFLVSDLSSQLLIPVCSLCSEGMSESFAFKKNFKKKH